jgi:hypothetical protein
VIGAALSFGGCKRFQRKHIPVPALDEQPYPTCSAADGGLVPSQTLFEETLRSGPNHQDKTIVESYRFEDRGCVYAMTVRQAWPLGISEVEVVWDRELRPLRAWKRMTIPGIPQAGERAEIRRYELRTEPAGIKRRAPDGSVDFEQLLGGTPLAIIGPGRGLIAAWVKRANLKVGEKRRELAIDVRALEKIELVTLLREDDMVHPVLGPVSVYTFYGRETVFVDERGAVVGDLAGLLPSRLVTLPEPPKLPTYDPPDPAHTP